jgi:hypothetical protein
VGWTLGTVKMATNVGRTLGIKTAGFASLFVIYRTVEGVAKEALFRRKYNEQEEENNEKRDC